jgi:CRP-like cAMP-binding protein
LSNFLDLAESDVRILEGLGSVVERYPADTDIIHQGQMPRSVFLLTEGMACRYRNMQDGRRQIMTFLLPGDFCDVHGFLLRSMDHSISTLTPVKLISVPRNQLIQLMFKHPRIAAALWWCSLQEEAILRERIVALGRRNARGRVAYLLCELWWRYDAIGLTRGSSVTLPLTQLEIADAIGLTPAHVNRVLMGFRDEDLINLSHRTLTLRNLPALQSIGDFNSDYLHLEGASPETAAYFDRLEHTV